MALKHRQIFFKCRSAKMIRLTVKCFALYLKAIVMSNFLLAFVKTR